MKIRLSHDQARQLATAEVDATQVRQIIMNLITNAAEAIGDKEGRIQIETGVMEADAAYLDSTAASGDLAPGRFAWLEVSDTGRGMDHKIQERIFDPFFTTKFTGRGLGLAALLGIVRQHGGTVKVQSRVGAGSTLRVLFPFAEGTPRRDEDTTIETAEGRGALPGRGRTVLIADDEKGARMVAAAILRQAGFSIATARDGHETLEVFSRGRDRMALVLLDMKMPGLGGEEVVPKLREIRRDVPVLICSGYTEDETKERFLRDEVEGFLAKPYRRDELIDAVERVLETARSNAAAAGA